MKFTELKKIYLKEQEEYKNKKIDLITNGYGNDKDRILREYSTYTRWEQYQTGKITRAQAVDYAVKRYTKAHDKETAEKLEHFERVANAPDLEYIRIEIEWRRSRVWGYNPFVETYAAGDRYTGTASGCGYDKRSAAVAETFNNCPSILKILYTLKENALREGKENNHDSLGYGSGYGAVPYFEGGVGVECFWRILEKAGFKVESYGTRTSDFYRLEKVEK